MTSARRIGLISAAFALALAGVVLVALAASVTDRSAAFRLGVGGAGAALLAVVGGAVWSLRSSAPGRDTLLLAAAGLGAGVLCLLTLPPVLRAGGYPVRVLGGVEAGRLLRAAVYIVGLPILWNGGRRPMDPLAGLGLPALLAWPVAFALAAALAATETARGELFLPLLYALVAVGAASSLAALRRWLAVLGALLGFGVLALASVDGKERGVASTLLLAGLIVSIVRRVVARWRGTPTPAA